ncbi:MAG: type II toxin-antitoxin system prevent-host-death family antitoxin [Clostridiales bacterium]|jgi:prevent-host-death family protein|nr:type II toxin-antitoxin system prevent-host-death family antitoxin [Clostridiales bacterium]MDR2751610.1 type II toxin-antitoxin system prevent-host-death family antitoxin [Clostridiales bacterium]
MILPVSDLRNYNEVLKQVSDTNPVFLTRYGRGKYVVLEIHEYDRLCAAAELLRKIRVGECLDLKEGLIGIGEQSTVNEESVGADELEAEIGT